MNVIFDIKTRLMWYSFCQTGRLSPRAEKTLFAIRKVRVLSFDHITPHDSHQKEIFALYVIVFYISNLVKGSSGPVISRRKNDSGDAHFRKALKVEMEP